MRLRYTESLPHPCQPAFPQRNAPAVCLANDAQMTTRAEAALVVAAALALSALGAAARSRATRPRRRRRCSVVPEIAAQRAGARCWGALRPFRAAAMAVSAPLRSVLGALAGMLWRVISLFDRERKQIVVRVVRGVAQISMDAAAIRARDAARNLVLSPCFEALMSPMMRGPTPGGAPSGCARRKTLVLDLDETLVHSQFKLTEHCDVRLDIVDDHLTNIFYVAKRPYLEVFLRTTAQWYDIAVYTASQSKYADPLISILDTDRVVQRRLYRSDCTYSNGHYIKDLTRVQPNLRDVLIVDNSPAAYAIQPANAVPIEAWYNDPKDEELLNLLPLLYSISFLEDVRSMLQLRLTRGALGARASRR